VTCTCGTILGVLRAVHELAWERLLPGLTWSKRLLLGRSRASVLVKAERRYAIENGWAQKQRMNGWRGMEEGRGGTGRGREAGQGVPWGEKWEREGRRNPVCIG